MKKAEGRSLTQFSLLMLSFSVSLSHRSPSGLKSHHFVPVVLLFHLISCRFKIVSRCSLVWFCLRQSQRTEGEVGFLVRGSPIKEALARSVMFLCVKNDQL